jgi:hypothetical protein
LYTCQFSPHIPVWLNISLRMKPYEFVPSFLVLRLVEFIDISLLQVNLITTGAIDNWYG